MIATRDMNPNRLFHFTYLGENVRENIDTFIFSLISTDTHLVGTPKDKVDPFDTNNSRTKKCGVNH